MLPYIIWIFSMLFHADHASYDAIKSDVQIPTDSWGSAAGYDDKNDIILIVGGDGVERQLLQFKNDEFIQQDPSFLPVGEAIAGLGGNNYFQLNHTLWVLNKEGTHFITINTHPPYDIIIPNITIPILVDNNGCLSMTHHHIFIVGGATETHCDAHNSVQIYDIQNEQWLSGVPSLPEKRLNVGCYVFDDTLYAIGGTSGENDCANTLDSILTLNVSEAALSDIASQEWQTLPATLSQSSHGFSLAQHDTDLIIIGGWHTDSIELKDINILDTITGNCYLAGTLVVDTAGSAATIHQNSNTLFIFGAYDQPNTVQYINLPTEDPTADPTNEPTKIPTIDPTAPPSFDPTASPTSDPTIDPTANPSLIPTVAPTSEPTKQPTTAHPTIVGYIYVPPSSAPTITDINYKSNTRTDEVVDDTVIPVEESHSPEVVLDTLAIILIAICGSVCFIILMLIATAVGGYRFKKKKKDVSVEDVENANQDTVLRWLTDIVELPQYYNNFKATGYDMRAVESIDDRTSLITIGIENEEHQIRILNQIRSLKSGNIQNEERAHQLQMAGGDHNGITLSTPGCINAALVMSGSAKMTAKGAHEMQNIEMAADSESDAIDVDLGQKMDFKLKDPKTTEGVNGGLVMGGSVKMTKMQNKEIAKAGFEIEGAEKGDELPYTHEGNETENNMNIWKS